MGVIKFNKTATKAQALASTDADKLFFPTDSYSIVMNKKTYGAGYESELQFGGNDITDNYGPIDASMVGVLGANRFAGLNSNNVTTEISYDSGNSWEAIDFGNQCVASVFADGKRTNYRFRATRTEDEFTQKSNKLRVTINSGLYSQLLKFVLYISTDGSGSIAVDIEGITYGGTDYKHIKTSKLGGWGGYNVINLVPTPGAIVFGGSSYPTHYEKLRFTFYIPESNTINTNHKGFRVYSIYAYGGMGWSTPSSLAGNGHLYKINPDTNGKLNAEFPNKVSAVSFDGKATSAEKASSLSPESGTTMLYPSRIVTENYEEVNIGTLTSFTGTYPTGTYTISSSNLYTSLENVKKKGLRPVLVAALNSHTTNVKIPLTRGADGTYTGNTRGSNGNYFVDVSISSSSQKINTQGFGTGNGTYSKPSAGIPESDLAQAVRSKLNKVDTVMSVTDTIIQYMNNVKSFSIIATKDTRYNTIQVQDYNGPDDIVDWIRRPIILSIEQWEGTSNIKEILTIPMSAEIKYGAGGYAMTLSGIYNQPDTTVQQSVSLYLPNTYYAWSLVGLLVKMKQLNFGGSYYGQIGSFY